MKNFNWLDVINDDENRENLYDKGFDAIAEAVRNENLYVVVEIDRNGKIDIHEYAVGSNDVSYNVRSGNAIVVFDFCYYGMNFTKEDTEIFLDDESGIFELLDEQFQNLTEDLEYEQEMEN